jgi:histone-lysine N-methyltransferase SETMAR
MLRHRKNRAWPDIVTLDESWFHFTTDHERIWPPEGTEAPEREWITVQSRKMMVTIVWNPRGFYRIVALPKGMKFDADDDISHIFDPLAEWRRSQVGGSDRRLHVHANNARPNTAKKVAKFLACNGMKRAPHPLYSPDLAPCEFYLFRYIKSRLAGASFKDPDQLLQAIDVIFQSVEKATLERVFRERMDRLV